MILWNFTFFVDYEIFYENGSVKDKVCYTARNCNFTDSNGVYYKKDYSYDKCVLNCP